MKAKLDSRHEITTEHPASHYGAGVLLIDGEPKAYGPADDYPESATELSIALGVQTHLSCAEAVRCILARDPGEEEIRAGVAEYPPKLTAEEIALVNRWLSQDPAIL